MAAVVGIVALSSLAVPALAAGAGGFDGDPRTIERIGSNTPLNSAIAISQGRFADDEALHVVLSRDDGFADSLAGAALTNVGPMLYTPPQALAPQTRTEIDRVLPGGGRIYLLGGTSAISADVEDGLVADGYDTVRLSGPSRVETSVAVAAEVRRRAPTGTRAILARAYGTDANPTAAWADSVTGGAWAANTGTPIVVTASDQMHPTVSEWLADDAPNETFVLGGTSAITEEVAARAPNPVRVFGPARDGTAVEIAKRLWKSDGSRLILVNGYLGSGWAFGLAAAGLAADADAPLLLVADVVPDATRAFAGTACGGPKRVDLLVVGGTSVVSQEVADDVEALDAPECPPRSFGNGTHRVPDDVPAGTYRTIGASPESCYWERLDGFSGEFEDIKANDVTTTVSIVTILPEDAGFRSERCATWSSDLSARSAPTDAKGGGDYQVGKEMAAGVWRNSDSSDTCYWERLSGWTGEFDDIIANGVSDEIQTVEVKSSDVGFSSERCGTWTRIQ